MYGHSHSPHAAPRRAGPAHPARPAPLPTLPTAPSVPCRTYSLTHLLAYCPPLPLRPGLHLLTYARVLLHHQISRSPCRAARRASIAVLLAGVPSKERLLSAGSAPLPSAAARAAQPSSVIWVWPRWSSLSFVSPLRSAAAAHLPAAAAAPRGRRPGEALVAKQAASENESLQRGPPPQGRREGHQPLVADVGAVQVEPLDACLRGFHRRVDDDLQSQSRWPRCLALVYRLAQVTKLA